MENETEQRSYWADKWERMHKMPSWLGSKYNKADYVAYCVGHYTDLGKEK